MIGGLGELFNERLMGFFRDTVLLGIFVSAEVNHAPDELPNTFRDAPQWLWGWQVAAFKAFISSRQPQLQAAHTEAVERADGSKKTVTDTVKSDPKPADAQPIAADTGKE